MNLKKLMKIKDGFDLNSFRKNVEAAIAEPYEDYDMIHKDGRYIKVPVTKTLQEGKTISVEYQPGVSRRFYIGEDISSEIVKAISEYNKFLGEHLVSIKRHSNTLYYSYKPVFDEEGQAVWDKANRSYADAMTAYYASKGSGGYTRD